MNYARFTIVLIFAVMALGLFAQPATVSFKDLTTATYDLVTPEYPGGYYPAGAGNATNRWRIYAYHSTDAVINPLVNGQPTGDDVFLSEINLNFAPGTSHKLNISGVIVPDLITNPTLGYPCYIYLRIFNAFNFVDATKYMTLTAPYYVTVAGPQNVNIYPDYAWATNPVWSNFATPSPVALYPIPPIQMLMNIPHVITGLGQYFEGYGASLSYSVNDNTHISWSTNASDEILLSPESDWFGTEYINIRATNQEGLYANQVLKVTVRQALSTTENFNNAGVVPPNWSVQHTGTTSFPWQPYQIEDTDYGMKTMAATGTTVNERLLSHIYNLSGYSDIQVSFDTEFLPYGNGSGTFAYTLNNVTYVTVEAFSTSTSGIKTYSIPAIENKPTVRFRWNYVNTTANTGQANYWTVDDFQVVGFVKDLIAPTVISGLQVLSLSSGSVTLGWNPSSDLYFDKYEIYISPDALLTTEDQLWSSVNDADLININTTETTVSPLATGDYWVAIRAVDISNNASDLSDVLSFQIDASAPLITNPIPANQPNPAWTNYPRMNIGCTITDANLIDQSSIRYRIDYVGNGVYDSYDTWQNVPTSSISASDRNSLNISFEIGFEGGPVGVIAFEFKVADSYGNIAYSGNSSVEGIEDDWVVRINYTPPVFSDPIPMNQPNPTWGNNRTVAIGCTIFDDLEMGTVEYRFDRNGNGMYDADEPWIVYAPRRQERNSRHQMTASVEVLFETDGQLNFEFRATDPAGNTTYSGNYSSEGIEDDWIVRINTTPPQISNPFPADQPNPEWSYSRTVTIGALVTGFDGSELSVYYRYDSDGNGVYDGLETWMPISSYNEPEGNFIWVQIYFDTDGIFAFEFKVEDASGDIAYSGNSGEYGIEDDWIVRINTIPPVISNPVPDLQPLPAWQTTRTIVIGAEINTSVPLDESSIQYRYDQNQNGYYDMEEDWQSPTIVRNTIARQYQLTFQTEIQTADDGVFHFEIKATDQSGLTGYSGYYLYEGIYDDWLFRIDSTAPAAIDNFFVESVTDNSVQLQWSASSDLSFLEYRVFYSLDPELGEDVLVWDGASDANLLNSGMGLVSTTITGLNPTSRYYLRVCAVDEVGFTTQYPLIITAMTSSSAPPSAPQNMTISVAGALLILDWDDVNTDTLGNTIEISSYNVFVGDVPDFECNSDTLICPVSESTLSLEDVVDYADRLFFKVIAVSGAIRRDK